MRAVLSFLLPVLLPIVVSWARKEESRILAEGTPLDEQALRDAEAIGLREPAKVRILLVDEIPFPANPLLKFAGSVTGIYSSVTRGLSLRYGIFIRKDAFPDRLIVAHECVHTAQYERLGGFRPFLHQYLKECITIGYPESPLEREAIERSVLIAG